MRHENEDRDEDEGSAAAYDGTSIGSPSSAPTSTAPAASSRRIASQHAVSSVANHRNTQSLGDMGRMVRPPSPPRLGFPSSPSSPNNKNPLSSSSPSFPSPSASRGKTAAPAPAPAQPSPSNQPRGSAPSPAAAARGAGHRAGGGHRSNSSSVNNSGGSNSQASVRPVDYWKAKKSPYGSAPPSNIPGVRPSKGSSSGYRPRLAPRKVGQRTSVEHARHGALLVWFALCPHFFSTPSAVGICQTPDTFVSPSGLSPGVPTPPFRFRANVCKRSPSRSRLVPLPNICTALWHSYRQTTFAPPDTHDLAPSSAQYICTRRYLTFLHRRGWS